MAEIEAARRRAAENPPPPPDNPRDLLHLSAIRTWQALAGRPALLGYLRAGGFPREMALEPGGRTLLVGNFTSRQLEAVNLADVP